MLETPTQRFTDRELKVSYWYITHKISLRRSLAGILIAVSVLMLIFVGWQLTDFLLNFDRDQASARQLIGTLSGDSGLDNFRPMPLQVSSPQVFTAEGAAKSEVLVQAVNSNRQWQATFDYRFSSGDSNTSWRHGFILPGQEKYFLDLDGAGGAVEFQTANLKWQRVKNYEAIYQDRFRFDIANQEFITGTSPSDPNRLAFDITNNSAYNYWEVGLMAFLTSGGENVSANYLVINDLKSGETRQVEMNWATRLPRIDGYEVTADVNILDQANLKKP